MVEFFADSNLFLQCRVFSEIDWRLIADSDDQITILIPTAVSRELDRLKSDGNRRRSKRAREASQFLRQIALSEDLRTMVRKEDPCVEIRIPDKIKIDRSQGENLDLEHPDDHIVAEMLTYLATSQDVDARLLTHDVNLMIAARRHGLKIVEIPEKWLLPPENDERDKQIARLRAEIEELKKGGVPDIRVTVRQGNGDPINELAITVNELSSIDADAIERLIEKAMAHHPIETRFEGYEKPLPSRFGRNLTGRYEPPSAGAVREYIDEAYPEWVESVRRWIDQLPTHFGMESRYATVTIGVENAGSSPAHNVLVELRCDGGLLMQPTQDVSLPAANKLAVPNPPVPPKAKWISGDLSALGHAIRLFSDEANERLRGVNPDLLNVQSVHRDRYAFYWRGRGVKPFVSKLELVADEFRHQIDREQIEITVFLPTDCLTRSGRLWCRVSASNLPKPCEISVPITIERIEVDPEPVARDLIEAA
jgi:PIN domain